MASPTYWIGADNNIYYGSGQQGAGVQNLGNANGDNGGQFIAKSDGLYDRYTDNGVPRLVYSASQISDPAGGGQVLGSETSGGTAGTSGSGVDPAIYDQAIGNIQSALGRSGTQLQSGNSGIDASYQNALSQLLLGKNQANQAYDTTKKQSQTDYVQAKNTIGANAGGTLNGLLRLLGLHGAGGSSAATIAAPQAVARGATLQRAGAGNTYGANQQSLDTNWGNYLTGYNNQVSSAGSQRDQQKQALSQSINSNDASLLQQLAQLQSQKAAAAGGSPTGAAQPYLDQANNILNSLASYTVSPINYQTQAYQAPSLASYTTSPQTPTYGGQSSSNDYFSPYLQALLGKKQPQVA